MLRTEQGSHMHMAIWGRCVLGRRNCPCKCLRQPWHPCLRYSEEASRGGEITGDELREALYKRITHWLLAVEW